MPQNLAEPRLATPGSGLYAEILGSRGSWRSPSAIGSGLNLAAEPLPGERRLEHAQLADGTPVLGLSLGIRWELGGRAGRATSSSARHRASCPGTASCCACAPASSPGSLLLSLLLLGGPRHCASDLAEPAAAPRDTRSSTSRRAGANRSASGWPRELAGVTGNLNALLVGERKRLERYRTTLGNLAHSLKTPLAALRGLLERGETAPRRPRAAARPHAGHRPAPAQAGRVRRQRRDAHRPAACRSRSSSCARRSRRSMPTSRSRRPSRSRRARPTRSTPAISSSSRET